MLPCGMAGLDPQDFPAMPHNRGAFSLMWKSGAWLDFIFILSKMQQVLAPSDQIFMKF